MHLMLQYVLFCSVTTTFMWESLKNIKQLLGSPLQLYEAWSIIRYPYRTPPTASGQSQVSKAKLLISVWNIDYLCRFSLVVVSKHESQY